MPRRILCLAFLSLLFLTHPAAADPQPKAFFVNLKDGDRVQNPVKIIFGIENMVIKPAGTAESGTGHFHLLIDATLSTEEQQFAIPADEQHIHFGKGQTETTLTLPPGPHKLQIVMGDSNHELHHPPVMSDVISVSVEP